jgi:hypothetical protein
MLLLFLLLSVWLAVDVPLAIALGRFNAASEVRNDA